MGAAPVDGLCALGDEGAEWMGDAESDGEEARSTVSSIGSGVVPRLLGDLEARGSGSSTYISKSFATLSLVLAVLLGAVKVTRLGLLVHSRSSDPSRESEMEWFFPWSF